MPVSSETEEEKRRRQASKVAESKASATPIQQAGPMSAPGVQQKGPSPIAQIGQKVMQGALSSALGPLGGVLGGLFNQGGKVDYAELARKKVAQQNAAIKAGAQGQSNAPLRRQVFEPGNTSTGLKATGETVSGDVIKGYANRKGQEAAAQVDPFEGIAAQIAAKKAAGEPVDYNALAALQHARSASNEQERDKAMRAFLKKHPEFTMPGGSQGVVRKNMGGPISKNPHGYNEGGMTQETPMKRVMDEQQMELKKMAADKAEMRKDKQMMMDEKRKQEAHEQSMKLKKAQAMAGPLSKPTGG